MNETVVWNLIDKFFKDNPGSLVEHHIESYNNFFNNDIYNIFKDKKPIRIQSNFDKKINDYKNKCAIYMGGKDGKKVYIGKPVIYDENDNIHYMFPNEARLRDMTYGATIHYDIEVEFTTFLNEGEMPTIIDNDKNLDPLLESGDDYPEGEKFINLKSNKEDYIVSNFEVENKEGDIAKGIKQTKIITNESNKQKIYQMTPAKSAEVKNAITKSINKIDDKVVQTYIITIPHVYMGKIPIMLQSNLCILNGLTPEIRHTMGECKHDMGGYFIIQGKEKTVICQEKFADNMLYIRKYVKNDDDDNEIDDEGISELEYLYSAEIKSVSENVSKPKRTLSIKIVAPDSNFTNRNIVVEIPNVRKPVPLFIVFRALGIVSDKAIIEMCLLDINKYKDMMDNFIPSIHDTGGILTQQLAIEYISTFTKGKTKNTVLEILSDYFLPHIGEVNYMEKAYYLGYMVFRLLSVQSGIEAPTDRDNYKYKRLELIGPLLNEIFSDYFTIQQDSIRIEYDTKLTTNQDLYGNNLQLLVESHEKEVFKSKKLDEGIRKAFKGNWGSAPHKKRIGVLQDLNRLSYNGYLSHLRKTNLPLDPTAKIVGPRLLNGSQWGFIDPIDTPDGGNVGLHKTLAISARVSRGSISREVFIKWLRKKISMKLINECSPLGLSSMTKVIINGYWAGAVFDPFDCVEKIKLYRRNALIPIDTSITFDITLNTIFIYTDSGRLCRPILYKAENSKLSIEQDDIMKEFIKNNNYNWEDCVCGFNNKRDNVGFNMNHSNIYELNELYVGIETETNPSKLERFLKKKAIIDYIDSSESENTLIALNYEDFSKENKNYTHMEIHNSLILGTLCNQVIFPENNPPTRNAFSCGQNKQACSIYHSNYQVRMDKSAIILNNGEIPLVKSRYLEYINKEEMPYGENAIVAIMSYGGYNMEDSILINEGSINRGLFNTTYYNTYEVHEEISETSNGKSETLFANIEKYSEIIGKKPGYEYDKLDEHGLIKEGTEVNENTVLVGVISKSGNEIPFDISKTPKKGQIGVVDKAFMTEGEEGQRIAKVKIREKRIPNIGDKMASRAGQKGTIGLVVPEYNMPFSKDGLKPDLIINPHAIPSRMTIGQLVECLMGKACLTMGGFGDCTAFVNNGSKVGVFGELLTNVGYQTKDEYGGYHSSGNEILYNGMTGEQIECEIFIGPTYYLRLKHMVKDKINYRSRRPNTALTRQPVSGRANDGGLRIGEMERDSLISHGMVDFLTESMMERADKYQMAICNNTGMMTIYNPSKNLFISPMCDGPVKFVGSIDGKEMHIDTITKFGRSFSIVNVPYSLKLLMQELMAINVQMRIITSDNIEQIENMSFSKNIENITGISDFDEIQRNIRNELKNKPQDGPKPIDNELTMIMKDDIDDSFEPTTPDDTPPDESPPYAPGSPISEMIPNSNSPPYAQDKEFEPTTPSFSPDDIQEFQPTTPSFSPPKDDSETNAKIIKESDFKVGEHVIYMEDTRKPKSQWIIKKVGPNFITIHRITEDGTISIENDIRIVERNQIHRPGDIVVSENSQQGGGILPNDPLMFGGAKPKPIQSGQPPVHIDFKPVMVMGEGHNITTNNEEPPVESMSTLPMEQSGESLIKFKPNIQSDDTNTSSALSQPSSEPATMKDLMGGNLTIKKV